MPTGRRIKERPELRREGERTVDADEHLGFGDLLRQHRNAAGLTQEDLAERAGLSPDTISLLERGEHKRPHRYTMQSLAEALGLSQRNRVRFETAARMPTVRAGAPGVQPANLSLQPTPFIGREREVEEVKHRLLHPDVRLLTLTGPGGVGKTRLGLEVARQVMDEDERLLFARLAVLVGGWTLEGAEGVALSLLYLGRAAHMGGDDARSNGLLEESLVVFKDSGDSRGVAEVLLELGRVAHAQGNEARALALVRESLVRSQKLDNKTQIAFCLTLAGVIQAVRDAARAARFFGAAEMLLQSLDAALDPIGSLEYDSNLADTRTRLGEEAFAKAWQEGMTMPLEQAVTEAMSRGS